MEDEYSVEENKKSKEISNSENCSAQVLLEMAKDEYTKERERGNSLDGKVSFFITAIIAMVAIFIPITPFERLIDLFQYGSNVQQCITICFLFLESGAYICLLISFLHFYDAYKLTEYKRSNLDSLENECNYSADYNQLCKELSLYYKEVVDFNIDVNEKKCDHISRGISLCGIGFLLLAIATVALVITIGG